MHAGSRGDDFATFRQNRNGEMAGSATHLLTASMIVGRC
jgi:hypothetical protein